jgi:hypothetical protein
MAASARFHSAALHLGQQAQPFAMPKPVGVVMSWVGCQTP